MAAPSDRDAGIVADGIVDAGVDVLDNFTWHALTSEHRHLAEGDGPVRRYRTDIAGFAALEAPHDEAWAALASLVGPRATVLLSRHPAPEPPATWTPRGGGFGDQMILHELRPPDQHGFDIVALGVDDVPAMLALVELTKPGPFRTRTIELGDYYGVFDGGSLVAMAGERLRTAGFTEISAVCTHPSVRGRGLAASLTARVAQGILERGRTPVLHVAEHNAGAKRVYERLGFVVRRRLAFVAVETP